MITKPDFAANRAAGQRYFNRWKQLADQGQRPVVVSRAANPREWSAWLAYYRAHGLVTSVDLMLDKPEKTVPTWWPHDFDLDTVQPDRRVKD